MRKSYIILNHKKTFLQEYIHQFLKLTRFVLSNIRLRVIENLNKHRLNAC